MLSKYKAEIVNVSLRESLELKNILSLLLTYQNLEILGS